MTTQGPDTTPPSAPTGLTLTPAGQQRINLSWTAATDNAEILLYSVERCQGTNCTTFAEVATPGTTSMSDYGLATATSYTYRVRASDAAGNWGGYSNVATASTLLTDDAIAPTAPTALSATVVSTTQITLAWGAATDNVAVTGYLIERCAGVGCGTYAQIAATPLTTFDDTVLLAGTSYNYRVRATDTAGNLGDYSNVATGVPAGGGNAAPTVAITSPANGATFTSPANITITATATDTDGTVTKVDFFDGATLVGTATSAPYTATIPNATTGAHVLTAQATDNAAAVTTSAAVNVTVNAAVAAQLYFIHTDHLNTPRLITSDTGQTVWAWANDDPYGNNAPNENPSGAGNFVFNMRLPGQYFDSELNTHYNYFRDYDPATGRYVQSDPIGLYGGLLSTFLYTNANPLSFIDPSGLEFKCVYVVDGYYERPGTTDIPATGDWVLVCRPVPKPSIGVPDPTKPIPRGRSRKIPFPRGHSD